MKKRLLSALLSICIIVGMLPAINVSAAEDGYKIVYDMVTCDAYTFVRGEDDMKAASYERTKQMWKYHSGTVSGTVIPHSSYGLQVASNLNEWIALEINVPASGTYDLEFRHGMANSNGAQAGGMWILPGDTKDIGAALTEESALATDICYFDETLSGIYLNTRNFEDITLSAGKHLVVYKALVENQSGKSEAMYPGRLTFTSGDGTVLGGIGAEISNEIEPAGTPKARIDISYYTSDGKKSNRRYYPSFKSTDETVAIVSENGTVTAVGYGKTEILVSVENEAGYTFETKIPVEIRKKGYKIRYDIAGAIKNLGAEFEGTPFFNAGKTQIPFSAFDYKLTNGFFEYFDSLGDKNGYTSGSNLNYRESSFQVEGGETQRWIALKVYVPASGTYRMEMYNQTYKNYGNVHVYVSKGEASVDDKDFVGKYDCNSKITGSSFPVVTTPNVIENISIPEAGEYIFTFKTDEKYGFVGTFDLISGEGLTAPMKPVISGADSGFAGLDVYMSDGTALDPDDAKITWKSSDENVAEVSPGGYITKKAIGEATISVEVEKNGQKSSSSCVFKVDETPGVPLDFAGVKESYNFYDVSRDWTAGAGTNSIDVRNIKYTHTSPDGSGNWEWYGASANTTTTALAYYASNAERLRFNLPNDGWAALTLNIPEAGKYALGFDYDTYNPYGGISEIYLMPKSEATGIPGNLTSKNLIGTVDYLSVKGWGTGSVNLGIREFAEKGEYVIVFKQISSRTSGYFFLKKLHLDGVNTFKSLGVDAGDGTLACGSKKTLQLEVAPRRMDRTLVPAESCKVSYESSDENIVTVDSNGLLTAVSEGEAEITVRVKADGITLEKTVAVEVTDDSGIDTEKTYIDVSEPLYVRDSAELSLVAVLNSGNEMPVPNGAVTFTSSDPSVCEIDNSGTAYALSEGEVTITAKVDFKGETVVAEKIINVVLHSGKTKPTYYTYEKREAAQNNVKKYDWAETAANALNAIGNADLYLTDWKKLYESIPSEGLPRSRQIGTPNDPLYNICRYCGNDNVADYGGYGFTVEPTARVWQVQCPDCKRLFPSNDFESFYKLGLDQKGYFDRQRALDKHAELFGDKTAEPGSDEYYGYGNPKGYLYNKLYPDVEKQRTPENGGEEGVVVTVNGGKGLRPGESAATWGVDDGLGYIPKDPGGNPYTSNKAGTEIERHCYIAYYNHYFWSYLQGRAITPMARAYLYTGEEKYGKAGAILLDRVADLYPDYDLVPWNTPNRQWMNTDGVSVYGKILGRISDCEHAENLALACDAFFPMLDNPEVIGFLSQKATEFGLENDKSTPEKIWQNWKEGILLEIFEGAKTKRLWGNFGMHQAAVGAAAIVLDEEPESTEMFEWLFATNPNETDTHNPDVKGGHISNKLIEEVDRDGLGNESGLHYNSIWVQRLMRVAEYSTQYKGEKNFNLYEHPKFLKMFAPYLTLVLAESHHVQIADSGATAHSDIANGDAGQNLADISVFAEGFRYIKDVKGAESLAQQLAQYIWLRNGKDTEDLNYGIFANDPEKIEEDILRFVDEDAESVSEMLTGYGFAVLRDGKNYTSANAGDANNNQRDFWMYYGRNQAGHSHRDELNIGMEAYGLNIAPELGYPTDTGTNPQRLEWVRATISHNTVLVDEKDQDGTVINGIPLHFDDSENVKLFDVDASGAYKNTDNYRRSVIMVRVNDDISYGVDFFRVTGGKTHTYSFHAQSGNVEATQGLEMIAQEGGTYAGVNTEYGADPDAKDSFNYTTKYPRGYTWLTNVRRDTAPESLFAADFEITDYRKSVEEGKGIRLRMTQVNDFVADEVAFVSGPVPEKKHNIEMPRTLEYMLVQRKSTNGKELDTLFTTVLEPYKNERYLSNIEPVEVTGNVAAGEAVKAVKVTHTNGRVDYVVYATDNSEIYTVRDSAADGNDVFKFRGFAAVYSVNGEEELLRYVNDGDIISADGEKTGHVASYSGTIRDYQTELSLENYIDVNMECDNPEALSGKFIHIENDAAQNAVYLIESARKIDSENIRIDIGAVSLIRGHKDKNEIDKGYVYNIAKGQKAYIPMSFEEDTAPQISPIENVTTSAGSSVNVTVSANSPIEDGTPSIAFIGTTLPRGASLNSETGVVTWKPDASQVGENHFAITARDSDGRESTVHFTVTVYGSTTSKPSDATETPENPSTGNAGSPGGGGGGETAQTPDKPDDTETDDNQTDNGSESGEYGGNTDNTGTENGVLRFTDLGNHSWAVDAINTLAAAGIIKGTSASTFSPSANITRADFALLLVRAFKFTSDNTENFADVQSGDYFAPELAIARNNGIVGGIGDNKFAPRNTITRQDMMVIIYRALQTLNAGFGIYDEPNYEDFATVADYAKEAVSALIGEGIVNGKSGRIAPTDYTTRAEIAVLIKRVLEYMK